MTRQQAISSFARSGFMSSKFFSFLLALLLICQTAFAAIDFDGTDDSINLADTLDDLGSQSMSMWVYLDDTNANKRFYAKEGGGGFKGWQVINDTLLKMAWASDCTTADLVVTSASGTLSTGNWLHIGFSWDGACDPAGTHLYLNGVEVSYLSTAGSGSSGGSDAALTAHIGNRSDDARCLNGKISDFAVWTSELTAAEFLQLGKSRVRRIPLQIQPSNLKAYLPLDDMPDGTSADGDVHRDESGNGTTGTGDNGANNTGLTAKAEEVLSYP